MRTASSSLVVMTVFLVLAILALMPTWVDAMHTWGTYHWARKANPFTLPVRYNLANQARWLGPIRTAIAEWNSSLVLDLSTPTLGTSNTRKCRPTLGMMQICSDSYGNNGWLGLATVAVTSDGHVSQGTVQLNDYYYKMPQYNTPAWIQAVTCQEIGHLFGLAHNNTITTDVNKGTCMDYTSSPAGGVYNGFDYGPNNLHPDAHDFETIESIYSHTDSTTTVAAASAAIRAASPADGMKNGIPLWQYAMAAGKLIGKTAHEETYQYQLGDNAFVIVHATMVSTA